MENESPVVVIGAGSTGSSTAYHLAKKGQRTVLIDRGQIASGMTSRSTALVRTHYSNEIVARMALYSLRVFENFSSIGNAGFVRNGMLILGTGEDKEALDANVKMLDSIGVKNEVMDKENAKKRFPDLFLEDCDYFLFEPESGYADPVGTAVSYTNKARELGAEVILGREVSRLEAENGKLIAVILDDGSKIRCSKVILCSNIWTNKLLSSSGVPDDLLLPIWTVAHPVVISRRPASYSGLKPNIADFLTKTYCKPEGQSLLFIGSLDAELDSQKVDPDRAPNEVPFEFMNLFSEVLTKRIPSMSEGIYHSNYIGLYDMSPDQHPIMDELSELGLGGVYCCVGLSGHGFKLCPALGAMNSDMILGVEKSIQTFERSFFSLNRFKKGNLLMTRYARIGTVA